MQNNRMMVMVASLERHLETERKIIYEAIVGQSGIPVGLSFPSMPANYLLKLNNQCLNDADYLFILIGKEYGPITEKGTSNLHQVYATAQAMRKPIVSFVYNGSRTIETDQFDQKRREGFISSLKTGSIFYWSNGDELRDAVERGLELAQENHPSVGWVKIDQMTNTSDSKRVDHDIIGKLKSQIDQLKRRIEKVAHSSSGPSLDFDVEAGPWLAKFNCNAFREGRLKQFSGELNYDIRDVFDWLSAALLSPITEARIQTLLAGKLQADVLIEAKKQWKGSHAVSDVKIGQDSLDALKKRLRLIGAIDFDGNGRWRLTQAAETLALMQQGRR
ncbi:DUF4062 domain-containing protein [Reinekea sp.]|jgi:hypothetical protein|uniref:DUF4062 domain-containing protein n=1 Tax=Reinekea sp. TaxID=1970455 RepID=UPI003988B317